MLHMHPPTQNGTHLGKGREDVIQLVLRDADARVVHADCHRGAVGRHCCVHPNFALHLKGKADRMSGLCDASERVNGQVSETQYKPGTPALGMEVQENLSATAHPLRELGCVANQVVQHLHDAARVAHHLPGASRTGGFSRGPSCGDSGTAQCTSTPTVKLQSTQRNRTAACRCWRQQQYQKRTSGVSTVILLRMFTPGLASASA